ELFRISKRWAP
ncbi:unnamed protein product, partial [Allacma fusca]